MNKIRTDYEIVLKEGQKIEDVYHEVGLPTGLRGEVNVFLELHTTEYPLQESMAIFDAVVYTLIEWGFCKKSQLNIRRSVRVSGEDKLVIYTE